MPEQYRRHGGKRTNVSSRRESYINSRCEGSAARRRDYRP